MDPVTHFASGALGGRALRDKFPGRAIAFLTIAAALLPDIDNFIGIGNPELYLIHHRGITHSFFGGLLLAAGLAGLVRVFSRGISFWSALLIAYACILVHIFLDLVTSYGTQVFAPFTNKRYAIGSVFIIDPILTLLLIGLWIGSRRSRKSSSSIAVIGLVLLALYPMANLAVKIGLENNLRDRLHRESVSYQRLELSPEILTPFLWRVVVEDELTYRMSDLRLWSPGKPLEFESFRKADRALLARLGERASFFTTFAWFAAYPVMETAAGKNGSRVVFGDLRFYSSINRTRSLNGENAGPFSLSAEIDRNGDLIGYVFGREAGVRVIQRVE